MCKKKAFTALFSLALAGSLAVPAWAAELPQTNLVFPADENPLTRAELITVLYEQEGKPAVHFDMDYTDVEPNADYAEAIRWASSEGIASGYGNGAFGPDDAVTREQMAVILYRYAQSNNQGFTGNWAFLLPYSDADVISGFAYEAVCWVTMKDLMGDVSDNCFAPKETVLHQDAYLGLVNKLAACLVLPPKMGTFCANSRICGLETRKNRGADTRTSQRESRNAVNHLWQCYFASGLFLSAQLGRRRRDFARYPHPIPKDGAGV